MKGIGKSIRENAEAGYLYHCGRAAVVILRIDRWAWRRWAEAVGDLIGLVGAILCLLLSPVIVPIAGYTRLRYYRRQMAEWQARQDKVDELHGARVQRMQSRVQKTSPPGQE